MNAPGTPDSKGLVDIAIVGGGITGLAAAWEAQKRGLSVRVIEARGAVGGKIRSEKQDGYLFEWGPNSFLGSATTIWSLIEDLKLQDSVISGIPPGDRYIFRNRLARRLPRGPGDLFKKGSDFMTFTGKLRMLAEPFVFGDARETDSLLDFARRRLGPEAAQYLVAPFVSGIYAGDAEQLGARDAFPQLWQWEYDAGSVVMGALLGEKKPKSDKPKRRGMFSFQEGLGTLPLAIAAALPDGSVQTSTVVDALTGNADHTWTLHCHATHDPTTTSQVLARQVVLAAPPQISAQVLPQGSPEVESARAALLDVQLCRVAVVHYGGADKTAVAPKGFGMLIPPGEGLRTLGILFPSSVFAGRAPEGHYLHSGFLGGARDPDAAELPDDKLLSLVQRAQEQAFPETAGDAFDRDFSRVIRWREAIPQYRVGHRERMTQARNHVHSAMPGVTLAGNYIDGISINDSAASGIAAVTRLVVTRNAVPARRSP
jgi:oxygen-dependent protoporphyrinogen oxidase